MATEGRRSYSLPALPIVVLGHATREQAGLEAGIMTTHYVPVGREFMGKWFNRELDYPERLKNENPDETSTENPFWLCRHCASMERERMPGILWCMICARTKRNERAQAVADSPAEVERVAAVAVEGRKRNSELAREQKRGQEQTARGFRAGMARKPIPAKKHRQPSVDDYKPKGGLTARKRVW